MEGEKTQHRVRLNTAYRHLARKPALDAARKSVATRSNAHESAKPDALHGKPGTAWKALAPRSKTFRYCDAHLHLYGARRMSNKTIKRLHEAARDDIGDLLTKRPLPNPHLSQLDPFLFLNHHGPQIYPPHNHGLPFGPHPHRGFETVTFVLEGMLAHQDSAGHESIINAGGVQWMTAGSGIVHAEVSPQAFLREGGPIELLQLWVNLPGRLKMTAPAYTGLQVDQIPAIAAGQGATVHLIAGEWQGQSGPINSLTGVFMSTARLAAGATLRFGDLLRRTVFLYVVRGVISIAGQGASGATLVELNDEGDAVEISAEQDSFIVFGHAEAIGEPVVAHGPFVMNTREQINEAVADYQAGKFGAAR
jgi:redox-sensitive bicupin YhaK (pirin superfamily)